MKRFPRDCTKKCEHYSEYDLSVDDYVGRCELLHQECDLCEEDWSFTACPLPEDEKPVKTELPNFGGD